MDENNLIINNKFFSFEGIIGRRDFFLNTIYIQMIGQFFYIPFAIWFQRVITSLNDINNISSYFYSENIFFKLYIIFGTVLLMVLYLSNMNRRLNDIFGKNIPFLNYLICTIFIITSYSFLIPQNIIKVPLLISILITMVINLFLIFTPGKITSSLPYDYTKEFNWGAFLGGWLWGLFNKTFVTLWDLLLFFTPFGFLFRLVCGLKGNEWAFKNKKWNDVEKFNESQEKQTLFWFIFSIIIIPIIYFILVFSIAYSIANNIVNNPNSKENLDKIEQKLISISSKLFVSYSISDNENKFYVYNNDWIKYNLKQKQNLLDTAASIASYEKNNKEQSKDFAYRNYHYKNEELKITKIYSADNLKLLAEYNEPEYKENQTFKDIVKDALNSYKFYNTD